MISLYDATRADVEAELVGAPRYRIDQVWNGLYSQFLEPHDITTLPAAVRAKLTESFTPALEPTLRTVADDGKTIKFLWRLVDGGHPIETVLMYYDDRATVCVSTQAGCAMACGFCATGQAGFNRHLTAGEIIEQVVRACREARTLERRVDNIVFMGMGEPSRTNLRSGVLSSASMVTSASRRAISPSAQSASSPESAHSPHGRYP